MTPNEDYNDDFDELAYGLNDDDVAPEPPQRRGVEQNRAQRRAAARQQQQAAKVRHQRQRAAGNGPVSIEAIEAEARSEVVSTEPFEVDLGDAGVISIGDPADLDYSVLVSSDINGVLALSMSEDDYAAFVDQGFTGRQMRVIYRMWRDHYGMGTPGE